ncbi:UNKNOWN [Stylonychia lemnae]|uniref:DUF4460 domain-containing protein n=1 Tax=Stylonychia lemnae TaxID=5949 RepID=A0A078AA70_STYLE|nr:UNKNOWN [Stylonychia lemnae]|eukprot:CDW79089.1 UNKNOWN [Stylonychia lemnae]
MGALIDYRKNFFSTQQSYASSFQQRAAGKAKLNQFLKLTHPDMFGKAPEKVRETNAKSVQELNQYLTSLNNSNFGNSLEEKELQFYVKKDESDKKIKIEGNKQEDFLQFTIKLLPLKPNQSQEIKSMHYTNTVDSLNKALEDTIYKFFEKGEEYMKDEDTDNSYKVKIRWDHLIERQKKPRQFSKELDEGFNSKLMEIYANQQLHRETENDLYVRKYDPAMKHAVKSSLALRRGERLRVNGLDPSQIFFNKNMEEYQVQNCVRILQGDSLKQEDKMAHINVLKVIGEALSGAEPAIYLMFGRYQSYRYDEIPGYISVPYQFKVETLRDYISQNHQLCRDLAKRFINLQLSYDSTLDQLADILPGLKINKKDQQDLDLEKYTLCMKHLLKYMRTSDEVKYNGQLIKRKDWLLSIILENANLLLGNKFKVFSDKSIEIPLNFKDIDFDEFLYEIATRKIYDFEIIQETNSSQNQSQKINNVNL